MNILTPASPGGERTSEPSYTTVQRETLNDAEWKVMWLNFCDSGKGMRLTFDRDEALQLEKSGRFNDVTLGGFIIDLLGVTAQTFVETDNKTMVRLSGKFAPAALPAFKDNSTVGIISPFQLSAFLDDIQKWTTDNV